MIGRRDILLGAGFVAASRACRQPFVFGTQAASYQIGAVNVESLGAAVDATASRNHAAFRAAIAATPTGGTLVIPARGERSYAIDTSGGLKEALTIDRQMTIALHGKVGATHGAVGPNPPYLFSVKAADVAFVGKGEIAGPGSANDANLSDDIAHPGLIHVTGDRFSFIGPMVRDVPKIGIHLWNCQNATITARWQGGIKDYTIGNTALFGIRATGGGGHRIVGNRFERDAQGRRLITGYFAGGLMGATRGDEIANNVADVHEKLAYLYTNASTVRDCSVSDAMRTDIIRIVGSGNMIERIEGQRIKGGVSIYNGQENVVRDCVFTEVYQDGIFVSFAHGYVGGLAGTRIVDNVIVASAKGTGLQDGICAYLGAGDTSRIAITGNRVASASSSDWQNCIRIETVPPFFGDAPTVRDNDLSGGINGLSIRRLRGGDFKTKRVATPHGGARLLEITS